MPRGDGARGDPQDEAGRRDVNVTEPDEVDQKAGSTHHSMLTALASLGSPTPRAGEREESKGCPDIAIIAAPSGSGAVAPGSRVEDSADRQAESRP